MTAREIQSTLIRKRHLRAKVLANFTPKGWWECDLLELTDAGFFVEYEIKLTLADFWADFTKLRELPVARDSEETTVFRKHDRLRMDRSAETPRRFWFVCPENVIPVAECPPYAGLIYIQSHDYADGLYERVAVKAPWRHREKVPHQIVHHAMTACYYRLNDLLKQQRQATREWTGGNWDTWEWQI